MTTFWQDLRYGTRVLARAPGFALIAVVTLALGIGANTAIFSVVHGTLLGPLPFKDAERLVWAEGGLSLPNYFDVKDRVNLLEEIGAWSLEVATLTNGSQPELIQYGLVSANLFTVLGVQPMLGRSFAPTEDTQGGPPVVILGYGLWQRQFGSDARVVGKTIRLNGTPHEVIGVLPESFRFLNYARGNGRDTEMWLPFGLNTWNEGWQCRTCEWLRGIGRLKRGATLEQAQAEMDTISRQLVGQHGRLRDLSPHWRLKLVPLEEIVVKDFRKALLLLLGAVAFVLLIACTNVANLLLARAQIRQKEMAVRTALGASRWRLVRQLLVENALLTAVGGALGVLVAMWGIDLLASAPYGTSQTSPYLIPSEEIGISGGVLLFAIGISVVTSLLCGLFPAFEATKLDVGPSLKEGGPGSVTGRHRRRAGSVLVIAEVALSATLLVGAGLLIKSLWRLSAVDPGFRVANVLTFYIALPETRYTQPDQIRTFYQHLLEQIAALPAVESSGLVQYLPLSGGNGANVAWIEGPPLSRISVNFRHVTPDYFKAMGIPLLEGRAFTDDDRSDAPPVAIINESMARRYWPGERALGKRLSFTMEAFDFNGGRRPILVPSRLREVVGVVADVRHRTLQGGTAPELFLPFDQQPQAATAVVVRTSTDPLAIVGAIRQAVLSIDKDQPISYVRTLTQYLSASVAAPRFNSSLMGVLAALALALAAVGVYGMLSYAVAQRTREIGIRRALGGQATDVLGLVIVQGMWPVLIGLLIGLLAAAGLTRLMTGLLFDVSPTDPGTFAAIALLLTTVALLACYFPARRATKVDPMVALRFE